MGGFSPDLFKRQRLNTTARGDMSGASSEGGGLVSRDKPKERAWRWKAAQQKAKQV